MVRRRGVGATIAAVAIFSVLLVSDVAVYQAAQTRQRLATEALAESTIQGEAKVLAATQALHILDSLQTFMSSGSHACGGAVDSVDEFMRNLTVSAKVGEVEMTSNASFPSPKDLPDNMSLVVPFNGARVGSTDVAVAWAARASDPSGVSFQKSETHLVNLPVNWDEMASLCLRAVSNITGSITGSSVNCSMPEIAHAFAVASSSATGYLAKVGLSFNALYTVTSSDPCEVGLSASVSSVDVQGPLGPFTASMVERWSASARG